MSAVPPPPALPKKPALVPETIDILRLCKSWCRQFAFPGTVLGIKFKVAGVGWEEINQIALGHGWKARLLFKPERGIQFSTFLWMYLRQRMWEDAVNYECWFRPFETQDETAPQPKVPVKMGVSLIPERIEAPDRTDEKDRASAARHLVKKFARLLPKTTGRMLLLKYGLSGRPPMGVEQIARRLKRNPKYVSQRLKEAKTMIRKHRNAGELYWSAFGEFPAG